MFNLCQRRWWREVNRMESLILAQDKRWRRASCMQVERGQASAWSSGGRVRNTYETCPAVGNNPSKGGLMPHTVPDSEVWEESRKVPVEGRAAD